MHLIFFIYLLQHVLFVLLRWFEWWEVSGHTTADNFIKDSFKSQLIPLFSLSPLPKRKFSRAFACQQTLLQGDTLAPYLFIICLDYILRTSKDLIKENGFTLKKTRSRRYLTKNDGGRKLYWLSAIVLGNKPAEFEFQLRSLEQASKRHWAQFR